MVHRHVRHTDHLAVARGFTLIELLVVTAIIVIISTLVLANNNRFGGVVLLENLAYDVALTLREAQAYGISVREYGLCKFECAYGMHFAPGDTYALFVDLNDDGLWDPDPDLPNLGEDLSHSPYTIGRGYTIAKLCAPQQADAATCVETGAYQVGSLDITFKRPDPDAQILADGSDDGGFPYESARIVLMSPRGDYKSVIVGIGGLIAVE